MDFAVVQFRYEQALREAPNTPPPPMPERFGTVERLREWKIACRAYDAAKLALGMVTVQQLQEKNAAVRPLKGNARIVRHEQYA